jgi:hypothetical protein
MIAVVTALLSAPVWAAGHAPVPVKGPGGANYGSIVFCNDCATAGKSGCFDGAENGYVDGKPCGKCFIDESTKKLPPEYPYDLHVTGKITNAKGEPVKERFVKLFMSNGWGHRTKTLDTGVFHLSLGATQERKGKDVVTVDVGTLVDAVGQDDQYFSMFFLPPNHAPCKAMAENKSAH